jgi:hypothetical protein
MKPMASHSSAPAREHTPCTINLTTNNSLKRRAECLVHDKSIDGSTRAIIRYTLEINDPMLLELVERVDEQKIEALTEIICENGDLTMRTAALLVLLASIESADDSKSLANTAKTRVVDAQVKMLERELFAHNSHLS